MAVWLVAARGIYRPRVAVAEGTFRVRTSDWLSLRWAGLRLGYRPRWEWAGNLLL